MQVPYTIRKADMILIAGCLLAAVLAGVFLSVHRRAGSMVRISCDGEEAAVLAFDGSAQKRYYLIRYTDGKAVVESCGEEPAASEEGFNLLSVTDGTVRMEAADCKDQICVRHRAVSAEGESIICLPHKVVVEITGKGGQSGPKKAGQRDGLEEDEEETAQDLLDGVVE